jgi:hypothetical protein
MVPCLLILLREELVELAWVVFWLLSWRYHACAQTGVGPQVLSHIFGLRKALDDKTWAADPETEEGSRWLASDDGNVWILKSVDKIVDSISKNQGSSFAPGKPPKL